MGGTPMLHFSRECWALLQSVRSVRVVRFASSLPTVRAFLPRHSVRLLPGSYVGLKECFTDTPTPPELTMRPVRQPSMPSRRGAAAVEMAIVLPVFFMVVMGIVEFGRAMMVGQLVTNGARYGARISAFDGSTNADVTTSVKTFVSNTVGVPAADVNVDIAVDPGPGNPDPADDLSVALAKDVCKVTVRIRFDKVGYLAGRYLSAAELKGICVMRHE